MNEILKTLREYKANPLTVFEHTVTLVPTEIAFILTRYLMPIKDPVIRMGLYQALTNDVMLLGTVIYREWESKGVPLPDRISLPAYEISLIQGLVRRFIYDHPSIKFPT
jgi:hypothetical protein